MSVAESWDARRPSSSTLQRIGPGPGAVGSALREAKMVPGPQVTLPAWRHYFTVNVFMADVLAT
jgi:hypothetical protein